LAYQTEKTLQELGEKISAEEKTRIEEKIAELRESMNTDDISTIRHQTEELQNAFHAISQQMYAQQQNDPGSNGHGSHGNGREEGEEVVEGEFREI
jgi:molecular chaperone DnaK